MKSLLWTWCLLAAAGVLAAPLEVFNLEGRTLTLEPGVTVQQPIKIIRWKYNSNLVVNWNSPDRVTYYEKFKGRTTLDAETLKLEIEDLTLSDGGTFSLETDKETVNSYKVEVIKNPPKPKADFKNESDVEKHHFKCVVDTAHLGPVTYQWKMDNGDWFNGTERLDLSVDVNPQEVSCKVTTRLSESEASNSTKNYCYKPAPLYEEGQTLTLGKCETVQQPITIIRWKHNGNLVVNWNSPDRVTYYGKFKGRTTLDAETLKLEMKDLTLSDGGTFSLETEKGPVNSYEVEVIKNPPKPEAFSKNESDAEKHYFKCVVDTTHLGPVTYQWKMDNGDWFNGTERLDLSVDVNPQEVSCKVTTRLSESEASSPTKNDCYKPAPLYEEGQTLTLGKCETFQQPIKIIRWKKDGNLVVNWNSPDTVTYYGEFKGRTTLDAKTLKLEIKDLTLSDGGTFSLETDKETVNSYEVEVIKNPPKPKADFKNQSDAEKHYFKCVVDTAHLGPVTYQWKMDNRDWFNGTERLDLSVDVNPQNVSCKVTTRLSESKASSPTKNDCHKPAPLYEEGQTLTLRKCVTVQQPIRIIRWKHNGNLVVNWNSPDTVTYYGKFKGRTTLDAETLKLEIKDLTLSDGGTFSLETDKETVNSYEVEVIKNPPKPEAVFKIESDVEKHHFKCVVDTAHLGPVTYQWKKHDGDWFNGTERLNFTRNDIPCKVSCKVITRLSESEASSPTNNWCYEIENPPKPKAVFPLVCSDEPYFMCVVDTAHLGPVTYQWKMDNGDWFNGTERLDLSVAEDPQEVSCKVTTRLSESEASSPTKNGCYEIGALVVIVITVVVLLLLAAAVFLVWKRPQHPLSRRLCGLKDQYFKKQSDPDQPAPAEGVPLKDVPKENPAGHESAAV